ncbi:ACP phosphodiesterase [Cytophagaceae bacterium ABcell3]|nr:ACP phosphodiesterase [Cytophagaceae bacterium ABcell3]
MNYLGHALLSGSDDILIGNFIADAVKGKAVNDYPSLVKAGILLHREIDCYTDSHPAFLNMKRRLSTSYRHYSGVIADIYIDHFLANGWNAFSSMPLTVFTQRVYRLLEYNSESLPLKFQKLLPHMISNDWLYNYSKLYGVQKSLEGLSRRTSFDSGMENAIYALSQDYPFYKHQACLFLSDAIKRFPGTYTLK